MSRITRLNQRYAACAELARDGVQIVAIGDPVGARFNAAVRRLLIAMRDDPSPWESLIGAAKLLRWRLITQPQPIAWNPGLPQLAGQVASHAGYLRHGVFDSALLEELTSSALAIGQTDPSVGSALLRECQEVGVNDCVVVAANRPAQAALQPWLSQQGILVVTPGQLEGEQSGRDQACVVGPPRFYRSSLVTAPVTSGLSFLMPAWFGDRSVPRSAIAAYSEGAIRVRARVFTEGDVSEPESDVAAEAVDEDLYLPQPVWGARQSNDREPTGEEVEARKVLLSGDLAIWLDDGERIRSLDPQQPVGERVTYTEVAAVRQGTYLLLREGTTERGALYHAAIAKLGPRGGAVGASQLAWKQLLAKRIQVLGHRKAVSELRAAGVRTADRARAWTDPNLIRPNSDRDFEQLLQWLDAPIQPTFGYASALRKALYQVSAEIREQLETAVSVVDLGELESTGHLRLDVEDEGFRGILATRVLGISPFSEIVPRHDARVPFGDRSGQWLE